MGLIFSLSTTSLLTGVITNIVRFPLEWAAVSRSGGTAGRDREGRARTCVLLQTDDPCVRCREYYAGRNTVGAYLLARYSYSSFMLVGPTLTAVIIYWMTGMQHAHDS